MQVVQNSIRPDNARIPVQPAKSNTVHAQTYPANSSFQEILDHTYEESHSSIQFSKHASMRLNARDIALSGDQLKRVESGVSRASEKGIRDSLVLVDGVALVVNVKNRTVITAMNPGSEQVFTNIDGAVIV